MAELVRQGSLGNENRLGQDVGGGGGGGGVGGGRAGRGERGVGDWQDQGRRWASSHWREEDQIWKQRSNEQGTEGR